MLVDVLLDLSGTSSRDAALQSIQSLAHPDGLACISGRVSCILPAEGIDAQQIPPAWRSGAAEQAVALSSCALEGAARERRPLVVLRGPVLAGSEPVSALLEALEADPMFGFALARVAGPDGQIAKLDAALGDPEIERLPRAILAGVPELYIVPETAGSCFAIRRDVVANFGVLEDGFEGLAGAWLHYLCRARRAGFRGVVVNRSVVESAGPAETTQAAGEDFWTIHRRYPDIEQARREFRDHRAHEHESLLARALSAADHRRKTLLVDARGLQPAYNGTADCILGLLDGLTECAPDWHIQLGVGPEASRFHRVAERYPAFTPVERMEQRCTLAVRFSQPWDLQTVRDLHNSALFNFYLMLDTISWDVLYNGTENDTLSAAWRFLAEYADGLLYISDFTRRRFAARFPCSPRVRHCVSYLPFHEREYLPALARRSEAGDYLLVIGNDLDHKWVEPTVELLSAAFPFQPIRALGLRRTDLPNVRCVPSGGMSGEEIRALYAGAAMVIFPSFYEGFGLPVLAGLSHGKAVVARQSSLLEEIAARCRARGKLYSFTDSIELMEIVARLLRGEEVPSLALGGALKDGEAPLRWRDVAQTMLQFMEASLADPFGSQWQRRGQQMESLAAARCE